jgi:hypothetical protein
MNPRRRVLVTGALGAAAIFGPGPLASVWAQSEGTLKLLRVPKLALVIGNSKYRDAPLRNPVNDAHAIGTTLTSLGFSVVSKLDAGRDELTAAVASYVKEVAAKQCVGLFYYAGHGVQLAWRNYMLPVDADIDTVDDVPKQAVDVNALMEGLTKAGNPLNVVMLDACRDNPFGQLKGQQRGLSQMDAPTNTLLAYATSPGNVASDGEGKNGLYTESLLAEMKVPEAKLEDVFKRVRLNVRRKSQGAQIPWESTSLEEDFYFVPPAQLKKRSNEEREAAYKAELALWESVKSATTPKPLEDFLRRYPSGDFSELAQLQLDRVLAREGEKKIEVVSSGDNPYTKGSSRTDTAYRVGDRYVYDLRDDIFSKVEPRRIAAEVRQVTEDEVIFSNGAIFDLMGNPLQRGGRDGKGGVRFSSNQQTPLEYTVGKHWLTRFTTFFPNGEAYETWLRFKIVAREDVRVPAGVFNAFRTEWNGQASGTSGVVRISGKRWDDPGKVRQPIKIEMIRQAGSRYLEASLRELVAFRQS